MRWLKKRRLRKLAEDVERSEAEHERAARTHASAEAALTAIKDATIAVGVPEGVADSYYQRALDEDCLGFPRFDGQACKTQVQLILRARELYEADQPAPHAPTDKMQLGNHAKRLLDDPVMRLAFERVASNLTNTWRKSAVGEHEAREATYRLHWALEAVKDELRYFMNNTALIAAEQRRKEEGAAGIFAR